MMGLGLVFCWVGGRFAWVEVRRAFPVGLSRSDLWAFQARCAGFPGPSCGLFKLDARAFPVRRAGDSGAKSGRFRCEEQAFPV